MHPIGSFFRKLHRYDVMQWICSMLNTIINHTHIFCQCHCRLQAVCANISKRGRRGQRHAHLAVHRRHAGFAVACCSRQGFMQHSNWFAVRIMGIVFSYRRIWCAVALAIQTEGHANHCWSGRGRSRRSSIFPTRSSIIIVWTTKGRHEHSVWLPTVHATDTPVHVWPCFCLQQLHVGESWGGYEGYWNLAMALH